MGGQEDLTLREDHHGLAERRRDPRIADPLLVPTGELAGGDGGFGLGDVEERAVLRGHLRKLLGAVFVEEKFPLGGGAVGHAGEEQGVAVNDFSGWGVQEQSRLGGTIW